MSDLNRDQQQQSLHGTQIQYVPNSNLNQPSFPNQTSPYGLQSVRPGLPFGIAPPPTSLGTPPQPSPYNSTDPSVVYRQAQNYNTIQSTLHGPPQNQIPGPPVPSAKNVNSSTSQSGDPSSFYSGTSGGPLMLNSGKASPIVAQNGPCAAPLPSEPSKSSAPPSWNAVPTSSVISSNSNSTETLYVNGVSPAANKPRLPTSQVGAPPQWPSQVRIPPPPGHIPQAPQVSPMMAPPLRSYGSAHQSQVSTVDGKSLPPQSSVPSSSGLPLPYNSQNVASSSPQVTPGASQPPSARSSRNPSPVSSQRYDYMEGQFSNKPSPSSSATNLQNFVQSPNMSHSGSSFPASPGILSSGSSMSPSTPTMNSYVGSLRPTTPVSNQGLVTSQPGQNAGLPPVPPPMGSTPVRSRYPQQVGYNQSFNQAMTSQASVPHPPMYNNTPNFSGLPEGPVGGVSGYDPQLHAKMAGMSVHSGFSRLWGNESINLLQDRNILPPTPLEAPKPVLQQEKPNCSPKIFRCTLTKIPDTSSLLQKSRLPLGILIHPFRDVSNLPVIHCNVIVRCRNCRTYINPFVSFVDQRRWKCNLCFRVNDLPEEFLYDPLTKSYGDPSRRPEIKNATIEFIAPSDYMLRPPQPAVYLFLLDVSHGASETGYLQKFCQTLLDYLDQLPGDSRTRIGFITFDGSIHFYNLGEGLNQPHMLVVSDVEDVFLPSPDNLLCNLHESKALIKDLLTDLPKQFARSGDTNNCLGAALQAAFKLMAPIGGRVTVIQTCLPNSGPGALKNREDPNQRAAKEVTNIAPASDFYKKLALDCSGQQIGVDFFLLSSQYADLATVSCISKFSSGGVYHYPGFHHQLGKLQVEKFGNDLKRYLTRKIGLEAVMRIRCTRGLTIHTFHGNFFVRSTDLLSLPNVSPDAGFGMQIAIDENLTDTNTVCFQAAVLYTATNGERRIRVHTLSLPVVSILHDVLGGADQEAIIGLVAKMAVDRSVTSSLSDARDALINVCVDMLGVFKNTLQPSQCVGALMAPYSTRLTPLFILALLKHIAFRTGVSTKLDDRVFSMERMKTLPLPYLLKFVYPTMYPVHALDDKNAIQLEDSLVPQPPILQLSSEKIDRHGAYMLDVLDVLYLYVGRAVNDQFCVNVLGVPNFSAIPEDMMTLPELPTPESGRMRNFISWLQNLRPYACPIKIIREDSKDRHNFLQYMLDDRTESLFSYYEFLQHLRQQISK